MTVEASLENLLHRGLLWRGDGREGSARRKLSTGFRALDEATGGWPAGALAELISPDGGGLSLLVPLLARPEPPGQEPRWLAWVDPPRHPHAPALAARGVEVSRLLRVRTGGGAERLWAAEQLLRSGSCSVVMLWPGRPDTVRLRRLQLAAEAGGALGVLFRSAEAAVEPSPAALRLRLAPHPGGWEVEVLKRRGGRSGARVELPCAG